MASPGSKNPRTPGASITEPSAFAPSIVGVQTAVPAFIGYTQYAKISGKPAYLQAIKIGSLKDFETIFGRGLPFKYTLTEVSKNGEYDFRISEPDSRTGGERYYNLVQSNDTGFNLYQSMRLFYAIGGGDCYVISVGAYTEGDAGPDGVKVSYNKLKEGLDVIKEQVGPTMLVIPDAVLLPNTGEADKPWQSNEFKALVRDMLQQCAELQDRVAILDVYGSQYVKDQSTLTSVIDRFRTDTGLENLNYGMAYFPYLRTTVVSSSDFDYTNIVTPDDLKKLLTWQNKELNGEPVPADPNNKATQVQACINEIGLPAADVARVNQNLCDSLPLLPDMLRIIAQKAGVLPPSGAMAGIYTRIDTTQGVWSAPANTRVDSVDTVTYALNDAQQGELNAPVDGKAINALREFHGRGTVVWGARTLDGNSEDWRYIQVRRTIIYIEQSIKAALGQFVFAANDGNTWASVVSMVSSFLEGLWSQGGLVGATAQESFTVACGLGSTMTGMDILEAYMIVQVTLQMIRPAEFIELTFKQKMGGVA